MRKAFAAAVGGLAKSPSTVFLTGDLGFMALEPIRDAFGDRFINVGVAEQNMMGVAAGLARSGCRVFAYSIAPFATLRALEQIKLDISLNRLNVCVVGNGGGYGYGYMGPTHHAIDDLAVMTAVGLQCLVPAFDWQIDRFVNTWSGPTYLRLGVDESLGSVAPNDDDPSRISAVLTGSVGHIVALGPLAGLAVRAFQEMPEDARPTVWQCVCLPLGPLPAELQSIGDDELLIVAEEHLEAGGMGQQLALALIHAGRRPKFVHRTGLGYPSGRYGSQAFHRRECGLDGNSLRDCWQGSSR